ncbi:MAG: histidine phosphatase family protein [Lacibacter sp.]
MKTLLLVRHAKSSWEEPGQKDFDRPLNERGLKDAPMMAKRLLARKVKVDVFISSTAKRAKKTCELFMKEFDADPDTMVPQPKLYLAEPDAFIEVIRKIDEAVDHAIIFSHNNGITDFANQVTTARIDDMPTCSVFAIKFKTKSWADFEQAEKEFWFFDYPKLPDAK